MTSRITHTRSVTPLHGLIIMGLAAVLVDLFVSAREFSPGPDTHPGKCIYQVFQDDQCVETLFLEQSETLSKILFMAGVKDTSPGDCEKVPCNRVIRLSGTAPKVAVEKIRGTHLIAVGKRINVNLADEKDLAAVPGIGPRLSERIITTRNSQGGFKNLDELQHVPGIGRKKLSHVIRYIEVGLPIVTNSSHHIETSPPHLAPPGRVEQ